MSTRLTKKSILLFESIKSEDSNGNEYWSSRKLARVLEYSDYRNFVAVIGKAREACKNSGIPVENHFVDITEMVGIGSGAERPVDSVKLSRYPARALARIVGMSESQMLQYKAGIKKISPKNIARINEKLRTFADETSGNSATMPTAPARRDRSSSIDGIHAIGRRLMAI